MKIQEEELSRPVKFIITEEPEKIKLLKEKIYEEVKDTLPIIDGFRKGTIPRDVAEKKFGNEKLYRKVIDDIYYEAIKEKNIVSHKDFKIFGDLSDKSPLRIEFIGELEPSVDLIDFESVKVEKLKNAISEEEIKEEIEKARNEKMKLEDLGRNELQNLDLAIIDFEGTLDGEKNPFKGGTSKDFQITVNLDNKSFIDTFEDQLIGMKIGEQKTIHVTFPDTYRDTSKAGKKAKFNVVLKALKKKIVPELNEEFLKSLGYSLLEDYKKQIEENLKINKKKTNEDQLKKNIIKELLQKSRFSPIPINMLEHEISREWQTFLKRMGRTEEDFLKESPDYKEYFITNTEESARNLIKTMLLLKTIANKFDITVSKKEVTEYTLKISNTLTKDKEAILKDLEKAEIYSLQEKAALNEKIISFLVEKFKEFLDE